MKHRSGVPLTYTVNIGLLFATSCFLGVVPMAVTCKSQRAVALFMSALGIAAGGC